jgi:citrate lyase subunit beta/citryl-CoA lyase
MKRKQPAAIRSFLFTPGNHPRKVAKVFGAGADAVILDLEDAVAAAEKVATRQGVVAALKGRGDGLGYVRVNPVDGELCRDDLAAVVGAWLDGVVVPKIETPEQLRLAAEWLDECERLAGIEPGRIDLMPIIETAAGVERANEIAASTGRISRLAFGAGDYTLDLDYQWGPEEEVLSYARSRLSHASRMAGIEPPVDTVVLQIYEDERFLASARRGRMFGFGGKLCIHPRQVPLCNAVFTPDEAELEHARAVVRAFEAAEAAGSASIQLDGYFIDYPIVYKAQRILALSERLAGPKGSNTNASERQEMTHEELT